MEATAEEVQIAKYAAYKDTGVEWLGEIPAHWTIKKLKFLGNIYAGLNGKKGDDFNKNYIEGLQPFVPFTNICNNHVISESQYQFVKVDEKENQNRVLKNDLLFLMSSETLEDIAKCSIYKGNEAILYLNSFCKGFRISSTNVVPEYVNYLFNSLTYRCYFSLVGRGFTRINLKQEYINDALTLLPPKEEQTAIAQFLDRKTAQIDKAIGIKEKQIELLKERRQVLIHNAVTRGLNPNVPMKDSGVEWIGEIPAHWESKRVKNIFRLIIDPAPINNKCELLSIYTDIGVKPRKELEQKGNRASTTDGYWFVKKGDFIVNKLLAWMGAIGLSKYEGVTSPAYDILRPTLKIKGEYYHELFRTKLCSSELKKHSKGIMDMRLRLYFDKFGAIKVPFPPYEEQDQISQYIVSVSDKIESSVAFKEKEIEKLKEYKASLINSAVTGKIKVC